MFRVGLTGGIASGKSTISQLFSNLGVTIIDTDLISHQLMQPGQPAFLQTVKHFGKSILKSNGNLNRKKLREIIFNQPQQKSWLEKMIHPLIRQKTQDAMQQASTQKYVLVVVPLMFETGFDKLLDHIIAINCPVDIQLKRLTQRDNINLSLAQQIIAAQMDNQTRINRADSQLTNADDSSRQQDVLQLHLKLLNLSASY